MDFIDHRSTANFIFSLSATDEKFRITNNGDVGIGTSSPSTKLEVNGVITTAGLTTTANINFGDNGKAVFGAGSDATLHSDGSTGYARGFVLQNTAGDKDVLSFVDGGATTLFHNNSAKLATTSTGIDVTGTATADSFEVDDTDDIRLRFLNASTFKGGLQIATTAGDMIGTSAVDDLCIRGQSDILFATGGNTERMKIVDTGIDVTGTLTVNNFASLSSTTLTIGGEGGANGVINSDESIYLNIDSNNNETGKVFRIGTDSTSTGGKSIALFSDNGDISFYEDTGTTAKLFWDASAESLGIGTSSPASGLELEGVGNATNVTLDNTTASTGRSYSIRSGNTGNLDFYDNDATTARVTINSSGNVGIGTSSPTGPLHVAGSGSTVPIKIDNTGTGGDTWRIWSTNDAASDGGGKLGFYNEDTATRAMTLDSSGRVGIGTVSPAAKLDIVDTSADVQMRVYKNDGVKNTRLTLTADDSGAKIHYRDADNAGALRFNNNLGEVMRITADTTRVGIGDSSPSYALDVNSGTTNTVARFTSTDSGASVLLTDVTGSSKVETSGATLRVSVDDDAAVDNSSIQFRVDGSTKATIDDSGNLLVGTAESSARIHARASAVSGITDVLDIGNAVNAAGTGHGSRLRLYSTTDENRGVAIASSSESNYATDNAMLFYTSASSTLSEKMRIDSSGNVLVGKTSADNTTAGTTIYGSTVPGAASFVRDSGNILVLNRLTTDGEIVALRKDGTTVGSIGTYLGDSYVGTGVAGLRFYDAGPAVSPHNTTTNAGSDGTTDLGTSAGRFKDLYLSGGVYLGGTGSANHLDDYEEGTFTPTLGGGTSFGTTTYTTQTGTYTKIGDTVHLRIYLDVSATTGSGFLKIGGIPFTVASLGSIGAFLPSGLNWGGGSYLQSYAAGGDGFLRIYYATDNANWQAQQITNETQQMLITIAYQVA